jgi:hypothetical protein
VWIGGGFFVGRVDVIYRWTVEFLGGVEWMLQQGLSSTDQQVRSKSGLLMSIFSL